MWTELGDPDHAIELLERSVAEGDPNIILLGVDVRWEKLRSDPRTVRILEELDLPVGTGRG